MREAGMRGKGEGGLTGEAGGEKASGMKLRAREGRESKVATVEGRKVGGADAVA